LDADHRDRLSLALNGKIQQHRQWMTRSYAVAIVFLEGRVIAGLGRWENPVNGETIIWVCLALSLLFADIAIHWRDLWPTRLVAAKAIPALYARSEPCYFDEFAVADIST
jgi:hypothetical protein